MSIQSRIEVKLKQRFAPERLEVVNESHLHAGHHHSGSGHHAAFDGEGETHFRVRIVAPAFAGLSRVDRHRARREDPLVKILAAAARPGRRAGPIRPPAA